MSALTKVFICALALASAGFINSGVPTAVRAQGRTTEPLTTMIDYIVARQKMAVFKRSECASWVRAFAIWIDSDAKAAAAEVEPFLTDEGLAALADIFEELTPQTEKLVTDLVHLTSAFRGNARGDACKGLMEDLAEDMLQASQRWALVKSRLTPAGR
jgi:hypothetical protein